jgi:predicted ATPase
VLIRFEVSNFRSILAPVELSMVAVDADRPEARAFSTLGASLLPVAGIFGPNASGKSNIIAALTWLRDAVHGSLRTWDDEIPIEPFAFAGGPDQPTEFTVESIVDGIRFEYVLELDRAEVRYEGLFHYPEKKRRRIFEREGGELKLQRGLGSLSGTRELLTARTLALSAARRFDEPVVSHFASDLLRWQSLGVASDWRRHFTILPLTLRWFNEPASSDEISGRWDRGQALALLRLADLGIDDVVIDTQETSFPPERAPARRIRMIHRTGDNRLPLDFSAESQGTRTWFQLIGPVLDALRDGSLLLFDELDASLHPTLSTQLIRLFHDPATNPQGAQLIFTSHDASLLSSLNRDEVWLTEKRDDGSTRLGALAEFAGERVRQSQNLERAYLSGRFGALPEVDRTELLRSLGLIG